MIRTPHPLRQTILVDRDDRAFGIERRGTRYCVGTIPHADYPGIWLYRWDGYDDGKDRMTPLARFENPGTAEMFRVWFTEQEVAA